MRRRSASRPVFALDRDGCFTRQGQRIVPVDVNYWPGSCGVRMWLDWPRGSVTTCLASPETAFAADGPLRSIRTCWLHGYPVLALTHALPPFPRSHP